MLASAFAEAGEFETARTFMARDKNAHRKVLLGTDAEAITPGLLKQALELCRRTGGSLEIFHLIPAEAATKGKCGTVNTAYLTSLKEKLMSLGIKYQYEMKDTAFSGELLTYMEKRRDLLLIVLGLMQKGKRKIQEDIARQVKCPVVVLSA
ncbi:MAG: universal stress protein [Thermodesulfobacteriota bacterium]